MKTPENVLFTIYLYITTIKSQGLTKDYCGVGFCNETKQHTLCKYQASTPATHCVAYEKIIKNDYDKQAVLDKINSRRNKVAAGEIRSLPAADSMMKLEWNTELETSAQRWADQCVKHSFPDIQDTCRDLGDMPVGQNIATVHGDAPGLTPMALVDVWYMELLNTNATILSRYIPSSETGHSHYDYFTQLVWEDSHQVGCGGVKFKERLEDDSAVKYRTIYRLVCNFAPRGNRRNKAVFSSGVPCSRCPFDGSCDEDYKALCFCNVPPTNGAITEGYNKSFNDSRGIIQIATTSDMSNAEETMDIIDEIFDTSSDTRSTKSALDYFAELYKTKQNISMIESKSHSCANIMPMDELLELIKKKLSGDPNFLLSSAKHNENNVNLQEYNDGGVGAIISRIYSSKNTPQMKSTSSSDYVNSTLLVDLIEAVIFRSSDRMPQTEENTYNTPTLSVVKPVMIQAEMAEIQHNSDSTGHYFFPEDDDDNQRERTESYYDNSLAASEVSMEIDSFKMSPVTRDFLEDILEADTYTDSTTTLNSLSPDKMIMYKNGYSVMKNFLHNIAEKSQK